MRLSLTLLALSLCLIPSGAQARLQDQAAAPSGDAAPVAAPQDGGWLSGHWEGEIELPGMPLIVKIDLESGETGWSGTIDIPAQGAKGLELINISVEDRRATFEIAGVPGTPTFQGVFRDGEISGDFTQGAARLPFKLGREEAVAARRPQDPEPPFPYREEEVTYRNGDIELAGSLMIPDGEGPFPAAVLVTGSGAQNRDEELFNHRPFLVLSDALARRGIAVLRSDDRGVGGSTGSTATATTADFAADALSGIELLSQRDEIRSDAIGIIGHSEGGIVGPMAAANSESVAFVVSLAGTSVSGREVLLLQNRLLASANGATDEVIDQQVELVERSLDLISAGGDEEALRAELMEIARQQAALGGEAAMEALGDDLEAALAPAVEAVLTPWFRFFLDHDPAESLARVKVPFLALNGTLDLQVDADQNLPPMQAALEQAGNPDATFHRLEGLNHLFQNATTGAIIEYGAIEETISPAVLELLGDWITERFGVAN